MSAIVPATPTEEMEQIALVRYLEIQQLRFSAVPSSTFTKSWSVKARNTRMGVRPGVPDLIVIIPPDRTNDAIGRVLFIELKRVRGGVVSPDQKLWIAALNDLDSPSVIAGVARGADEAIETIQSYLRGKS